MAFAGRHCLRGLEVIPVNPLRLVDQHHNGAFVLSLESRLSVRRDALRKVLRAALKPQALRAREPTEAGSSALCPNLLP